MTKPGRSSPHRRKRKTMVINRKSVLKMLTVMSESGEDAKNFVDDFLTSGRTGRRNALPDIMGDHSLTSTADLPEKLTKLTTKDSPQVGTSGEAPQGSVEVSKEEDNKGPR
ncbi:cAMP-dependent protein kinase inhibitor beta-like [Cimex lectularius]|uniref:cAMP-dependent protein kinase inhibitor n=1 Tax=Cimex lectularius TaxID=79782 RepID=A0A8I6TLN4_CIMLE|nr:cAMP-dependent protein kinase inhibitor beta-like [Cimex lectularius]XP_024080428.1 cAMP-dependent protein kinase inhibitor beta-like [Cimex lectularius]